MRLIVIGASGFIGSSIYQVAKLRGIDVVGTSTKGSKDLISYDLLNDEPDKLKNNLPSSSEEKIFAVVAAGKTNIKFCHENKKLADKINVDAVKKLLIFFSEHNVKTLYFSSDYVFDGVKGNYTENSPVNPLGVYGEQKAIMEKFILENLTDILIYRITKSIDDEYRDKNVFKEFYDDYRAENVLRCIRGLTFNPTYVIDMVDCIFLGLQKNLSGLYNVANPETFSRFELVKKFIGFHDKNFSKIVEQDIGEFNFSEPRPLNTTLNVGKFVSAVDKKFVSVDEVIKSFWNKIGGGF